MACRCDGYPPTPPDPHETFAIEGLCQILAEHEARGEMGCFDEKILAWWREHKRRDLERLRAQMQEEADETSRQLALKKLSPHERGLLGIKHGDG